MIAELETLYGCLFEEELLQEINQVGINHHEIAMDLHSSRVVISRVLKQLEHQGRIELHRNSIKMLSL